MPQPRNEEEEYVTNASDRKQQRAAKKRIKNLSREEADDIRKVLSLPEGQRVLWRILKQCRVFETIWHPSALIHYNAGQQDLGHMLMAWINDASPETMLGIFQQYRSDKESEE